MNWRNILIIGLILLCLNNTFADDIFDLTFQDGLAPSGWSVAGTATWAFNNFYAETTTNDNAGWYYKDISETLTDLNFGAVIARGSTAYIWIGSATGDQDTGGYLGHLPNGTGYSIVSAGDGTGGLVKSVAGVDITVIAMALTTASTDYDLNISRLNNTWTLYRDGAVIGTYDDSASPITTFQYAQFYLDNGNSSNPKTDNFYLRTLTGANFLYSVDSLTQTIDFNSVSQPPDGNTAVNWNWTVDGVVQSYDENFVFTGATEYTDYNACLNVAWSDYDINGYICKTINSGKFYGDTNFYFFNEDTGLATSATIDFNGTSYTGTSFYLPTKQITNNSSTNSEYTFTITKTDYGTRYYTIDLNQNSDLNIGFLMLPDTNGITIDFKFWETDQAALLTNADIIVKHANFDYNTVGRLTTNGSGETSFFLNPSDSNYQFYITASDGDTFFYKAVSLTVNKPKAESSGLAIDSNWSIYLSGLGATSDTNIDDTSKVLAIYSDTIDSYIVTVSSLNADPEYYDRSYELRTIGNAALTLQPYLATTDDATQVKLVTKQDNGAEVNPYPGLTIKIYKLLPDVGRSLIEQIITDQKGEALVYLQVGDTYEFEVYDENNVLFSFDGDTTPTIKVTSATIYITIDTSSSGTSYVGQKYWNTTFTPTGTYLTKLSTGTQVFGFTVTNSDAADMNILSYVYQNDHNFLIDNNTSSATSFTVNHAAINWSDINKGIVYHKVIITVDGNIFVFTQSYVIQTSFGGYYDPINGLKEGIRTDFGCNATTGICVPTLIIAFVVCLLALIIITLKVGFVGGQGSAIIFVIMLALFTYLTWVPLELTVVVALIVTAFVFNDRGQRGEA